MYSENENTTVSKANKKYMAKMETTMVTQSSQIGSYILISNKSQYWQKCNKKLINKSYAKISHSFLFWKACFVYGCKLIC